MQKLRHSSRPSPSDKKSPKKWYKRALAVAVASFMLSCAPTPVSIRQPKPLKITAPKQVSFEEAKENPKLRQAYIDGLSEMFKSECISKIVYQDTQATDEILPCDVNFAYVNFPDTDPHIKHMRKKIGKREKSIVYVCPAAFGEKSVLERMLEKNIARMQQAVEELSELTDKLKGQSKPEDKSTTQDFKIIKFQDLDHTKIDEEHLISMIGTHEEKHACDMFYGIKIGEKLYIYEELVHFDPVVLNLIMELRAYGEQMREGRMTEMEIRPFTIAVSILVQAFFEIERKRTFCSDCKFSEHEAMQADVISATIQEYGKLLEDVSKGSSKNASEE